MAYNKTYSRINWVNDVTPINENNLNKIDYSMDVVDTRVRELDLSKIGASDISQLIKGVSINDSTGVITFTRQDNSTFTIDTALEKVVTNFDYDSQTKELVLTLADGTQKRIPMSAFINVYNFVDSDQIDFTATGYSVTAGIKANSITEDLLDANYKADCKLAVEDSESWAKGTRNGQEVEESDVTYHNNSKYYSELSSENGESWARGTRNGQDIPATDPAYNNNSKYYANQSKDYRDQTETIKSETQVIKTQTARIKSETQDIKNDTELIKGYINDAIGVSEFFINAQGQLIYTDNAVYEFTVDDNGKLNYEVKA